MKTPLFLSSILILLAGIGALGFYTSQLSSELDETRSKMHMLEEDMAYLARTDSAKKKKASGDGAASSDELKELEDRIGAVFLKAKANSKRLDSLEAGDITDLGLGEMLGGGGQAGGANTPAFAERSVEKLGDRLELTPLQQQRVSNLLNEAKEDAYAILEAAKQDDPEFLEAVGGILRGGGNLDDKARKILPKLFSSNVPGTDESYFSALLDIRHNAIYGFRDVLSNDQLDRFKGMKMDIFSIRTDYNPFLAEGQENP